MRFLDSVAKHRNLYCPLYAACLDIVVKEGWEGWSCLNCPNFAVAGDVPLAQDFATAGRRE